VLGDEDVANTVGLIDLPCVVMVQKKRVQAGEAEAAGSLFRAWVPQEAGAEFGGRTTPPVGQNTARRGSGISHPTPTAEAAARPIPEATAAAALGEEEDEERLCRVCFEGVEAGGRLFSPCSCRGSMRYVHVACLNEWRTMSANSRSFHQCDQCGYRYNLMRTEWASYLESPTTATVTATVAFVAALALSSMLFGVVAGGWLGWEPACAPFYDLVDWQPHHDAWIGWLWRPWLDSLVGGALMVGLVGLGVSAKERMEADDFDYRALLLTVLANDERILRVYVVLGVGYAFTILHDKAKENFKRLLTHYGEMILEVQQ